MRKIHAFVADHLGHSKPTPLPPGSDMIPMRVYQAKAEQWEIDVLMVMDSLEMGQDKTPFHRGEFLDRIDRQFREDERCRSGDPPVDD